MLTLAFDLVLVVTSGLQLERVGEVGGCQLWRELPRSLHRVLPTVAVGAEPSPGDLVLALVERPGGVWLQLANDAGELLLVREVPVRADLCTSSADVIALMTERYLRDLGWDPSSATLPALVPRVSRQSSRGRARPPWMQETRFALAVPAELGDERPTTRWGASLGASGPVGPLEFGVGLRGMVPATRSVRDQGELLGSIRVWSLDSRFTAAACLAPGSHQLCANLAGGIEVWRGEAAGRWVYQRQSHWLVRPLLSLGGTYTWAFPETNVGLLLSLGLACRPWGAAFQVEAATSRYVLPLWSAEAAVGVAFWPF